jgi:hypothetical protein
MTTTTKTTIVRIDSDGSRPQKARWGWSFGVVYTLADGRRAHGTDHCRLKRDAVAAISELPKEPSHHMEALYNDQGQFTGTATHFRIGGTPTL